LIIFYFFEAGKPYRQLADTYKLC